MTTSDPVEQELAIRQPRSLVACQLEHLVKRPYSGLAMLVVSVWLPLPPVVRAVQNRVMLFAHRRRSKMRQTVEGRAILSFWTWLSGFAAACFVATILALLGALGGSLLNFVTVVVVLTVILTPIFLFTARLQCGPVYRPPVTRPPAAPPRLGPTPLGTHGTAAWATLADLEGAEGQPALLHDAPGDSPALGFVNGKWLLAPEESHVLTVAPPGAGKGVSTVIPNLLTYQGSVVVFDPKGENFFVTASTRREFQPVFCLDPFGVTGRPTSGLNPIDLLDPQSPEFGDQAGVIADMLVIPTPGSKDPYWDKKARAVLRTLLLYVAAMYGPGPKRSLRMVREILSFGKEDLDAVVADMKAYQDEDGLLRRAAADIEQMNEKERLSVLSTLRSHTEFLESPLVAEALERSSFDIRDLCGERGVSVYIVLPADKITAYAGLARVWLATCRNALLMARNRNAKRVLFLLDEVAQLQRMQTILDMASLWRGYGLTLWLIFQDLGQMKSIYPDGEWQTLMSCCAAKQFFGVDDYDTSELISKTIGQTTVLSNAYMQGENSSEATTTGQTYGTNASTGSSMSFTKGQMTSGFNASQGSSVSASISETLTHGRSSSQTQTEAARALITPDEVRTMRPDHQVLLLRSRKPIHVPKPAAYFDELSPLFGFADDNPTR